VSGLSGAAERHGRPAADQLLGFLVPGLCWPERIGFENSVNLIRTGQDLQHGVGHRHLLNDVTLLQPLLAIDKEAPDAAVGVRYLDFVAHAVRLAVNLITRLSEPAAVNPGRGIPSSARRVVSSEHASDRHPDRVRELRSAVREADAEALGCVSTATVWRALTVLRALRTP
jgi:hypothetical protein